MSRSVSFARWVPSTRRARSSAPRGRSKKKERTGPRQYLREVRDEMRKVAWPKRPEVKRYSIIVIVTIIVYTALVGGLDYVFSKLVRMVLFDVSDETMSDEMTTDDRDRPTRPTPRPIERPTTDLDEPSKPRHRPRRPPPTGPRRPTEADDDADDDDAGRRRRRATTWTQPAREAPATSWKQREPKAKPTTRPPPTTSTRSTSPPPKMAKRTVSKPLRRRACH